MSTALQQNNVEQDKQCSTELATQNGYKKLHWGDCLCSSATLCWVLPSQEEEGGVIWENSTLKGWQLLSQVPSQCSLPQKKPLCSLISDSLQALPSGHLRRGYSLLGFPPSLIQPPMTGNIGLRTQKCLIIELALQIVQTMEGAQLSENQLGWSFQSTKKKIRFFCSICLHCLSHYQNLLNSAWEYQTL